MITKFKVDILKKGQHNNDLLNIIAAHNQGLVPTSILDLISYANNEKGKYPSWVNRLEIWREDTNDTKLFVTEDGGETTTLVIEEIEVHELAADADDLKGINI